MTPSVPSRRSALFPRRLALALAPLLLSLAACSDAPKTPGELFERLVAANTAGRPGEVWDLLTPEHRAVFAKTVDDLRDAVAKNPGAVGLLKQFNCSQEEFRQLPVPEIWRRSHRGQESYLVGAKIVDRHADPDRPEDTILDVKNDWGDRFRWVVRPLAGGGYGLQHASLLESGKRKEAQ